MKKLACLLFATTTLALILGISFSDRSDETSPELTIANAEANTSNSTNSESAESEQAGPQSEVLKSVPNRPLINGLVYPGGYIDMAAVTEARQRVAIMKQTQRRGGLPQPAWIQRGPNNIQGRITALAVDPTNDEIAYVAAAEGGIFKTTDSGDTWVPVFDDMPSMSMGAVALDPTNPNIVYAGTGESNPAAASYPGSGLYRSLDGGATWTNIGLETSARIHRIVIQQDDPDTIFVAVGGYVWTPGPDRGVYRTTDGGATWERVLFVGDQVACSDIVQRSDDPNVLFAAMWERYRAPGARQTGGPLSGVYKSTDGGDNWVLHENGLPTSDPNNGRIGLAISPSDPDVMVYVLTQTSGAFASCYRTTDGGDNWTQTNDGSLGGVFSSFGWYFGNVRIHPTDPETFYVVGFVVMQSSDGGSSFTDISGGMHVDHHGFAFGAGASPKIYAGNDGGVYVSTDSGASFIKTTGDLPITQAYRVSIADWDDDALWLGTQDNGSNADVDGDGDFNRILGGDGFEVIPHLTDPDRIWAQFQWGNLRYSSQGGGNWSGALGGVSGRTNWDAPHVQDPSDPETRYFGSNFLYRNDGNTDWTQISPDLTKGDQTISTRFGTLTTIGVSPVDGQVIWAGADDGNVHVTQDGGTNWTDVTAGLPNRWVKSLRPHPTDAGECLCTVSGFQWGEDISHVYRTTDFGQNWTSIGGGLPDMPINDVMYDPKNSKMVYAASDIGVFNSPDLGQSWGLAGSGMPNVSVLDFAYRQNTRELVAGTHGRSIYTLTIPQVYADSLTVVAGTLSAGSEVQLAASDNEDLSIRRGNTIQSRVAFDAKSVCPIESPSQLEFVFEASVFARANVTQTISLFNYDTDAFEVVDSRNASRFGDEQVRLTLTGDVSRFVQPGTKCMEARVQFTGSRARLVFTANVDQLIWYVLP